MRASASRSTGGSPRNASSSSAGPQSADHASRFGRAERRGGEHDVADRLGEDAAEAEHDAEAELRVAHQAGEQLAAAAHELRDEQLDRAVLGSRQREELRRRGTDGGPVGEPDPHQTALRLVGDGVAAQLQDDREADLLGGPSGGARIGGERLARHRHAVARDERLRGVLGERMAVAADIGRACH